MNESKACDQISSLVTRGLYSYDHEYIKSARVGSESVNIFLPSCILEKV